MTFKKLSEKTIKNYIKRGNPLKYAGSYTVNDISDKFIEKIEGDPLSVIGLPVATVVKELKKMGVEIPRRHY